jgi:hypothetical protein
MSTGPEKVLAEATHKWIVERIDTTDGVLLYVEGAEFPLKRGGNAEELWAVNTVKKLLKGLLNLFGRPLTLICILPSLKQNLLFWIEFFNSVAGKILKPHRVSLEQMGPFARGMERFLTVFLIELGIPNDTSVKGGDLAYQCAQNIAHIFEYDQAYRWRVQDLLSETTPGALLSSKELKKLSILIQEREIEQRVGNQSQKIIKMLRLALWLPKIRKALQKALDGVDFSKLQFDESDVYWCCFWNDYRYRGMTAKDRDGLFETKGWKIPVSYPIDEVVT